MALISPTRPPTHLCTIFRHSIWTSDIIHHIALDLVDNFKGDTRCGRAQPQLVFALFLVLHYILLLISHYTLPFPCIRLLSSTSGHSSVYSGSNFGDLLICRSNFVYFFSCDSSSIGRNVCLSVGRSVGRSVCN